MRKPTIVRGLGLTVVLLLSLAWALSPSQAQFGGMAGGSGQFQSEAPKLPTPMVYVARPITEADARIHAALREPIPMPFEKETPLDDVLRYIKQKTETEEMPGGIPIYVDPVALNYAEQTLQSPVTINLESIPLETTLRLVLDQLDLGFFIKDGMLLITAKCMEGFEANDPTTLLLNELAALRHEVTELRKEVKGLQRWTGPPGM
ncbi:hypothetical protein BH23PLA1_BH23PLA1_11000 [soil metagenome]